MLLNRLELEITGREIVNKGVYASNNFTACITLINQELKKRNLKNRKEWSVLEFKKAHEEVEDILDVLTRKYKGILND